MKQLSRSRWTQWLLAVAVIALAAPATAQAVTDEEIFRDFRFNLSNPGARSLGLGGAFIAVADDATASLANPAGLMLLERPEFFTEIRNAVVDDSETEVRISTNEFINSSTYPSASLTPSFVSYVHPWERFAVGFSRVELNKTDNRVSSFDVFTDPNLGTQAFGGQGQITAKISAWNISGAVKIIDSLSFGATVAFGFLEMRSDVINSITDPNLGDVIIWQTSIDDNDTDVAFNAGLHWKPLDTLAFGAVYRGGHDFTVEEDVIDTFFGGAFANFIGAPLDTTMNTPDTYGAGVMWQPLPALTLSADWVHIEYEDLVEGLQTGLNPLLFIDTDEVFKVDNADEIHFGAEYVFTGGPVPIAARAGFFTDHNSRLYSDLKDSFNKNVFPTDEAFPERDTETHITVGGGAVIQQKFQIDFAADFSDIVNEYVLSTIFRF